MALPDTVIDPDTSATSSVHGIFKVVLYGSTESSDMAGWTVTLKLNADAPGSDNTRDDDIPCKSAAGGSVVSSSTNSFTFTCDGHMAATSVVVTTTSYKDLAEIVVAGHVWSKYPCPAGKSSPTGTFSLVGLSASCQECEIGTYQDLAGQKFCRPSKYVLQTATDKEFSTYLDASSYSYTMAPSGSVYDVVVYNINFDDYSSTATSNSGTESAAAGSCASTLAGYQDADCVKKIENAQVKLMDGSNNETPYNIGGTNDGTSRRDQTYTVKLSNEPAGITTVAFSKSFILAELLVYSAPTSTLTDKYNDEKGATEPKTCGASGYANAQFTGCEVCPEGQEKEDENGNIQCSDCAAGKYRLADYDGGCKDCEAGSFSSLKSGSCTKCEIGKKENGQRTGCTACEAGKVAKTVGSTECTACSAEGPLHYANSGNTACDTCDEGTVPNADQSDCKECPAGQYRDGTVDVCTNCPTPKYSASTATPTCSDCDEGMKPKADRTGCEECPVGHYRSTAETECTQCGDIREYAIAGSSSCTQCPVGHVPNSDKSDCDPCPVGMYRGVDDMTCQVCPVGQNTEGETGQEQCVKCPKGKETKTINGEKGLECVDCAVGFHSAEEGTATCVECVSPKVALTTGQSECVLCEPGMGWTSSSTCETCPAGKRSKDGLCEDCSFNEITKIEKQTECTRCEKHYHSIEGQSSCLKCDDPEPEKTMKDTTNELQWQKCVADLGPACEKQTVDGVYGTFVDIPFMRAGNEEVRECQFDPDPKPKAKFKCEIVDEATDSAKLVAHYDCIKTPNTGEIEKLATEPQGEITPEKTEEIANSLKDLTSTAGASSGIGDVEAAADVIGVIAKTPNDVSEAATENLVSAVNSLAGGDLETEDLAKKADITKKMVDNLKMIAQKTAVTNKLVKSANIAIMKVKPDTSEGAQNNGYSFVLPDPKDLNKLDQSGGGGGGGSESQQPSIAIQSSSAAGMSVVLLTGDAFFPSEKTGKLPAGEPDSVTTELFADLEDDIGLDDEAETVKYVNSVVLEIDIGEQEPGFVLNLYIKPNFQVGDTSKNLKRIGDKRVQIRYQCAWYNDQKFEWVADGCDTIYDSNEPTGGVVCSCTHNTSFAVLMAAEQIDPGYIEVQSMLSRILLAGSILGLIATISLILPASAIVTTRSAKVNICFSIALLIASLLFFIQDFLIKDDNSGIIKLKSTGCIVYTMLQHYMWLVVFMWTIIEGFLMYLSLVQVFGSHISHYMIKFNALAYGVPIVFPLAGYFAFTRKVTVAGVEVVDHQYMAETMCFLKPGTINFYALFFGPLVLSIMVNLVFFFLVLKVIRSSKNSNLSDKEQLLRQLKAAVGVMVLLGTGWVIGVFMNVPAPGMQVSLQYVFIIVNASQGMFVFLFYVVLNDAVKNFWLEKFGLKTAAPKSGTGASTATNVYANASASGANKDAEHTYSSAAEFPAKRDDNANL